MLKTKGRFKTPCFKYIENLSKIDERSNRKEDADSL